MPRLKSVLAASSARDLSRIALDVSPHRGRFSEKESRGIGGRTCSCRKRAVSLHGNPIIETADLSDGRQAHIRVGIAEDSYVADRELNTVVLELRIGHEVVVVLDTILN